MRAGEHGACRPGGGEGGLLAAYFPFMVLWSGAPFCGCGRGVEEDLPP
jgi:hypothetical protein